MLFYIYMIHHKDWFKNVDAILFFSVKSRLLFKTKSILAAFFVSLKLWLSLPFLELFEEFITA